MNKQKIILFYLIIAALFTPFLINIYTYFPFIISKATAFRLIVELMLVVWAFWLIKKKESRLYLSPLAKAVLIFGVIMLISALFGADFYYSFFSGNERMEGLLGLSHFFLFFLIIATTFNYLEIERILKIQIGVGVLYSFVAILAYSGIGKITSQLTSGRLAGYTGNPSYFAVYLLFNAFLALYFYFRQYVFDKKLFNWWLIVFLGQSFLIFATLTRGSMMGYLISVVLIFLGIVFSKIGSEEKIDFLIPMKKIAIVSLVSILVLSVFTFSAKNIEFVKNNRILSRFTSISLTDPTAISRIASANTAFQSWKEKPLFGWGIENYEAAYSKHFDKRVLEFLPGDFYFDRAHNKPMEVLATTGIFGFLSYLSIFGIALYFLNRLRKKKEWFLPSLALAGGLTGYFIQNIFIFDFHESYLMFFLSLAFISSIISENFSASVLEKSINNNFPKDYALKMGKALFVIVISCAVIFSTSQWIIKPYIVSKNIQTTALLIKKGEGNTAYNLLRKTLLLNTFFQEDIIMPVKRFLKANVNNIESAEKEKIVNLLLEESYKITEKHPLRYRLLLVQADLEMMSEGWDKQALAKAEMTAKKVIELAPNFPNSHLLMSKILFLGNRAEQAMEASEKVIALNPNLPEPHFILALGYKELGNKEKQLEELTKAIKLGIRFTDKESVLGAVNIFLEKKRYDIMEILYKQAIQLDPQDATLYASLATTYAKLHNKEKAIEYAKKAVEIDSQGYTQASQSFIQWVENEQWELIAD